MQAHTYEKNRGLPRPCLLAAVPSHSPPMTRSTQVAVGDTAPDFSLQDQDDRTVSLTALLAGDRPCVVLYFYPKDDTPGCTVEACSFRDAYAVFSDAGAEVVGISS